MNVVTLRNGRQLEDPVGKAKPNEIEKKNSEPQGEEIRVESEKLITPSPFKPKIPFPQRFAKSKLDEQFKKFIEMMNKLYIDVPFEGEKNHKKGGLNCVFKNFFLTF